METMPADDIHEDLAERIEGAPVRIVELTKDFGPIRAVDCVSIAVKEGEFLALLGPSGSGKTTILMTVAGFEQPTRGEVFIGDCPMTRVPPHRRDIGMVFQKYALFPHMTVAKNIAFPLRQRGVQAHKIGEHVNEALEAVRLPGYGDRMPDQLSGGQQQRVALARAIVYRPRVLLMDEPLGALDRKLREYMQLEIKHLQQKLGATVVYVTHDQEEALRMADRVGVLDKGCLMQIGSPQELYDQPANSFVAGFIGEMNFFEGTLHYRPGGGPVVALKDGLVIEGSLPDGVSLSGGDAVQVAVRPERVTALRRGAAERGYAGLVRETVYSGASIDYIVELRPSVVVTARVPSNGRLHQWRVGDVVDVTWLPQDARVYEKRS